LWVPRVRRVVARVRFVCPGADFRCLAPLLGQAVADALLGWWLGLELPVASAFAPTAGEGGLVEWPVIDGLAKVDLPECGSAAEVVPGVQTDDVVADEGDASSMPLATSPVTRKNPRSTLRFRKGLAPLIPSTRARRLNDSGHRVLCCG
jgi:hypothetical protein